MTQIALRLRMACVGRALIPFPGAIQISAHALSVLQHYTERVLRARIASLGRPHELLEGYQEIPGPPVIANIKLAAHLILGHRIALISQLFEGLFLFRTGHCREHQAEE
ncbi:MAG: hypothetical protein VCB81_06655 [Verrucomicrobiia bacterium]